LEPFLLGPFPLESLLTPLLHREARDITSDFSVIFM
jgi:hypothetical protein